MEKSLEEKILETVEVEDEFYDSYMTIIENDEILSSDEAMQMFDFYYDELFELENIFNLLTEISVTYFEKVRKLKIKLTITTLYLKNRLEQKTIYIN